MSYAIRMTAEPLRTLAAASIGVNYAAVGNVLAHPVRILLISNLTDADVVFSIDGINDHVALPSSGFILLDAAANQTHTQGAFFPQGMGIFAKRIGTPTAGNVYVSVFYATADANI